MDTEKVRVVEQVHTSVTNRVNNIPTEDGLSVTGLGTEQDGTVTIIEDLRVTDSNGMTVWSGYANMNVGGNFQQAGREVEAMAAIMEFVNAIKD